MNFRLWLALFVAVLAMAAPPAVAQRIDPRVAFDVSRGDALSNPAFKGPEVLDFIGLKKGDRIADIVSGRFATAFAEMVGPQGRVYAVVPTEIFRTQPQLPDEIKAKAGQPQFANVEFSTPSIDAMVLPGNLDAVFIRQNYHDLHVRFMGPADVAAFNRKVFAALKPGGVFVVIDHAAVAGSGLAATETLHRIDPAAVKAEVTASGFVLDGESAILANPADPHNQIVLDPAILGQTDQFMLRFRKPAQ
jgi:predicted methyltransferase